MLKYRVLKEIPMRTSHVSVKNQVKEAAKQIKEKSTKRPTKIDILYFDEMFVNKKNIWLQTAVDQKSKILIAFEIGTKDIKLF